MLSFGVGLATPDWAEGPEAALSGQHKAGEAAVSAITFWELAMLHEKGRMRILADIRVWRATLLDDGLMEIPVDGDIGIRANGLVDFHPDPADRIIVATALEGHQLITADERILDWPGDMMRLDARM